MAGVDYTDLSEQEIKAMTSRMVDNALTALGIPPLSRENQETEHTGEDQRMKYVIPVMDASIHAVGDFFKFGKVTCIIYRIDLGNNILYVEDVDTFNNHLTSPYTWKSDEPCDHQFVDTGMRKTWCKLCDVGGEYVNGAVVVRPEGAE